MMLELAAEAYPNLDRLGCLLEIDRLGSLAPTRRQCWDHSVRERLLAISRRLYEVEGFHGNVQAYYEPENSYLNEVLDPPLGHSDFAGHLVHGSGCPGRLEDARSQHAGTLRG